MSEKYTIARINIKGESFEVLVKPEEAFSYRIGKLASISKVLVSDTIYSDAKKGMKASEGKLKLAFETLDNQKIAETILKRGILQLTTEQRRKMMEEKRKQIVAYISRNCIDPKTKIPHPPIRIEQAMNQIHYSIDPFKTIEEQSNEIIKLLRPILPISIEKVNVQIHIPSQYASKVYGMVKGFGTIKKEEWGSDGSLSAVVEMIAGAYGPFLEKIGETTKGDLEAKII